MKITLQPATWGLLLAWVLSANQVAAQSPTNPVEVAADDLQPLALALEEIRSEFNLPGLAAGIVSRQGLSEMAAVGVRKAGSQVAVTQNDLWHLGSCTKAMTATLLATLVQAGQLSWETKLVELFPELDSNVSADFQQITLEHLLTHRSGLPANGPWRDLGDDRTPTEQRMELLKRMSAEPLKHPPGSKYEYSNVGYALAGLMAEQLLKQSWEQALRERVLRPLKIDEQSIGFGVPGTPGLIDQPWGHYSSWFGLGPLVPVQLDNASSLGPAGTVHATLDAWGKFIALHLNREHPLLQPEVWDKLHTPPAGSDYALGWIVQERSWAQDSSGKGLALAHAGSNKMNYCVCWLAPQRGFAVLAATNTGQTNAAQALDKVSAMLGKRAAAKLP